MTSIADGTYTAVVDRLEDDLAVVLIEDDDSVIGEVAMAADSLPPDGQHVDAVLTVEIGNGALVDAWYEEAETHARQEGAQSRFDRLADRPPSDEDEGE